MSIFKNLLNDLEKSEEEPDELKIAKKEKGKIIEMIDMFRNTDREFWIRELEKYSGKYERVEIDDKIRQLLVKTEYIFRAEINVDKSLDNETVKQEFKEIFNVEPREYLEGLYNKICKTIYGIQCNYLFSWDDVPGNNKELIKFLKEYTKIKINWVEDTEIKKVRITKQ